MSDVMFYGVLRMPYEIAMEGEISRFQFWSSAQEAANRVEKAESRVDELDQAIAAARARIADLEFNIQQRPIPYRSEF